VVIAVIMIVWMVLGVGVLAWIGYGPLPGDAPRYRRQPPARGRS
jgi:hypothetical protein